MLFEYNAHDLNIGHHNAENRLSSNTSLGQERTSHGNVRLHDRDVVEKQTTPTSHCTTSESGGFGFSVLRSIVKRKPTATKLHV